MLIGHEEADVMSQEEDKKAMMLQRFQKENPGFDFSGNLQYRLNHFVKLFLLFATIGSGKFVSPK